MGEKNADKQSLDLDGGQPDCGIRIRDPASDLVLNTLASSIALYKTERVSKGDLLGANRNKAGLEFSVSEVCEGSHVEVP